MAEVILETPRFPDTISYGSSGGPGFNTSVTTVNSGTEKRNINWIQARHTYDVSFGVRNQEYLNSLIEFFQAMKGKAYGFRYKDWSDYSSSGTDTITGDDQLIGLGDSTTRSDGTRDFQIIKSYTLGSQVTDRIINKIVDNATLVVKRHGVTMVETTHYTVDYNTGIITFNYGQIPLLDSVGDGSDIPEEVTCGYFFDVPVRFDTDELSINLEMYEHGTTNVPLVELRI